MKNALVFLLIFVFVLTTGSADTRPAPEDRGASGLALSLRRLQTIASVLHTAAHPDDESTELLAYLARGVGARVAYLSLNRGEGGQNGIGPELGDGLGVIRTEELLAARKLDGAEQYFTRAFDFGFTSSAEETLRKWNREEVLGDMVRVIRTMRPLVVITGFSGSDRDGHGQHQVAGLLTPEAIKAAADPQRFPEQLIRDGLQPWQVLKLYGRRFTQVSGPRAEFDVGVFDPVLGRSPAELANEGRSRHRSQDFGRIQARGSQRQAFPRLQSLVNVPEIESSLFSGIDVSLTGIADFAPPEARERMMPGLRRIKELAAKALAEYRIEQPETIGQYLAEGLREARALRAAASSLDPRARATVDGMLARKEKDFSDALIKAHGVMVDALSNTEIVTPGETIEVRTNVYFRSIWVGEEVTRRISPKVSLLTPGGWRVESLPEESGQPAGPFMIRERPNHVARFRAVVPQSAAPTQPYWLAKPRTRDQYDWDETMPRTLPFGPPIMRARVELELSGERVTIDQDVEYRYSDKTFGEIRRELKVAPALTLAVHPQLLVIPSESRQTPREISVEITHNARQKTGGSVKLIAPPGWKVESGNQPLAFTRQGEHT